jgi:hypothetical protein
MERFSLNGVRVASHACGADIWAKVKGQGIVSLATAEGLG